MFLNHNLFYDDLLSAIRKKIYIYQNENVSVRMGLRSFEASAKLSQQCVPVGIHLELINKELMLLVTI